jgi:hypothetical protein
MFPFYLMKEKGRKAGGVTKIALFYPLQKHLISLSVKHFFALDQLLLYNVFLGSNFSQCTVTVFVFINLRVSCVREVNILLVCYQKIYFLIMVFD